MRVIAGEAKGRTLKAVPGGGTRSATGRVRESLFGILEPILPDARVLDLFAGAGTIGIEALSRGAARVTFVEKAPGAVAVLRRNLVATGFVDRAEVVPTDVLAYLAKGEESFDVAFCDPPHADMALLETILEHPGLRADLIIVRVPRKNRPTLPQRASVARERPLGDETLIFLRYSPL